MISSSLLSVLLFIALLQPWSVQSIEYATSVILNNGTDSATMSCTETEWLSVQAVIDQARSTVNRTQQRSLFSESSSSLRKSPASASSHTNRDLGSARCQGGCKFGMKYCRFIGGGCAADTTCEAENGDCQRQRRQLQEAPVCTRERLAIDSALNTTQIPNLSTTCQALIRSSMRQYKCLQLAECNIDHFALWNADTDQIITNPFPDRGTVCSSQRISFQAVTNFHIGKVQLSLTSGRSTIRAKIEYDDPYFLTNTNWGYDIYEGLQLRSGFTYTLKAWPEDNPTK